MTSWILGIDKGNPEHWGLAKKHGFWDVTARSRRDFQIGDRLYYWQAGKSLLGSVVVTKAIAEMPLGTWMPWNIDDEKRDSYRFRVWFDNSVQAVGQPKWSELARATGVTAGTNFGPQRIPATGETWMESQMAASAPPEISDSASRQGEIYWQDNDDEVLIDVDMQADLRTKIERSIVIRRGQAKFRTKLLAAYGLTCAVTGTGIEALLEAAHIMAYKGDHTDSVTNGLLLRADIHTLFDLHMVTINEEGIVHVSPELQGTEYMAFNGTQAALPAGKSAPRPESLRHHNSGCGWLTVNSSG